MSRRSAKLAALTMICMLSACGAARASAADSVYRYRKGLHLSREHSLTSKELDLLLKGLHSLTGFSGIEIDTRGDVTIISRAQFAGGSETARNLFAAALFGEESFTIESADHSSRIAFAELDSPLRYSDGSQRSYDDWRIKIDFADFKGLHGDAAALASFDPAMAFLHELAHALLGHTDPVNPADELGDCERYLNRIRAELGLPERQHYYPEQRVTLGPGLSQIYQGTLTFMRKDQDTQKRKQLLVIFDLNQVFDISQARSKAVVQNELLAQRNHYRGP